MDLAAHKNILTEFAQSHLTGDASKDSFINLKLEHSLHVHKNAQAIIEGENLTGRPASICHLAALYHDIGRFPQLARYGTFNDRESTNHGRLGVLTLRNTTLPNDMTPEDMQVVRLAIGQHNIKSIRKDLPEPYATPAKLVRDADKIDIFRVMIDNFSSDNPDPVVTHGHKDVPGKYTSEIYEAVMQDRPGDYTHIQYANDFKLMLIGWLRDLNFQTSLKILIERDYIESIFSFLPQDESIRALKDKIDIFTRYNYQLPS